MAGQITSQTLWIIAISWQHKKWKRFINLCYLKPWVPKDCRQDSLAGFGCITLFRSLSPSMGLAKTVPMERFLFTFLFQVSPSAGKLWIFSSITSQNLPLSLMLSLPFPLAKGCLAKLLFCPSDYCLSPKYIGQI